MLICDRYIIKHIISAYIYVLLIFTGLYLVIDIFSHLNYLLKSKPPLGIIVKYYALMFPFIFLKISPFAFLISNLFSLGEMNKNNEIISLRASGISILRICLPIIFLSLFVSAVFFLIQEKIVIKSQNKVETIKRKFIEKKANLSLQENFAFTSSGMIVFVRKFYPKKNLCEDVTIFEENKQGQITKKYIVHKVIYKQGKWQGKDIIEYILDAKGNIKETSHLESKEIPWEESPFDLVFKQSSLKDFSTLYDIRRRLGHLKKIKALNLITYLTIDYHQKIAEPLSHFFLTIGILPLALEIRKRKVALSSLGIGLVFCFIYYSLHSFSIALGKAGIIIAPLAAYVAALFFLTMGLSGLFALR